MKFIISHKELTKLICDKFGLPEDTQVVVSRNEPKLKEPAIVTTFRRVLNQAMTQYPGPNNKIAAIKRLRELGAEVKLTIGLAEAKYAVENPDAAIENLKTKGIIY